MKQKLENMKKMASPEELNKTKITVIERKEETDLTEEVMQNMQNIFVKELHKLRNNLFYQQNVFQDQILGIKV